ncbi:hypothetical protein OWR28_08905 [Chryseobacterium sp. 1B4]
MKNLKKISRESLKQVKGGLIKKESCVELYGCPQKQELATGEIQVAEVEM